MADTSFLVPADKKDGLAAIYARNPDGGVTVTKELGNCFEGRMESGGGGLVSTAGDYLTFCSMLLNKGAKSGRQLAWSQDSGTNDLQSSARRHGRHGATQVQRERLLWHRVRTGLLGDARPGQGSDPGHTGRYTLGRRCEHGILGGPDRRNDRYHHDATAA